MRRCIACLAALALIGLCQQEPVQAQSKKAASLIKELSDPSAAVRRNAAEELGNLAELKLADAKTALPALNEAMKDKDGNVRLAVITTLGKIEMDSYAKLLIDALKTDKDPIVLVGAITAIGQIGEPAKDAVDSLIEVYKASPQDPPKGKAPPPPPQGTPATDPPAVRRAVLGALPRIQPDPKGRIPFFIDSLKVEKDPSVRIQLVNAVGQMGPTAKEAIPALLEMQKTSLAEAAKITFKPKEQPQLDPQGVRRGIIQALGRIDPAPKDYLPILIDTLKADRDPAVRQAVAQALAQMGPPAKTAVPSLLEALKPTGAQGDYLQMARTIVNGIAKIETDPKESVPHYIEILKKEKDPAIRYIAVTALGEIGPPAKTAIPALLDVQKASPPTAKIMDPQGVRKAILEAMAKMEPEPKDFVPILIEAVKRDRDPAVRTQAVTVLANLGPMAKAAVPALTDLTKVSKTAKDDDKALAKEAESALEKINAK